MTLSPQGLLPLVVRTKSFPWAKRKAENRLRGQKYHRCELGDLTKGKDTKCLPCPEIFQPLLYLLWIHKWQMLPETPTCSFKKVLQNSNFAKVKITSALFSLPFIPVRAHFYVIKRSTGTICWPTHGGTQSLCRHLWLHPSIFNQTSSLFGISALKLTGRQLVGTPGL